MLGYCWLILLADDDFEEGLFYKPTAAKPVAGVPENKIVAKKKHSSSAHSQQSSTKVHVDPVPVANEQTSLVSTVKYVLYHT